MLSDIMLSVVAPYFNFTLVKYLKIDPQVVVAFSKVDSRYPVTIKAQFGILGFQIHSW
jgi:hypothetical protein